MKRRCWPDGKDPLMDRYHDEEWGVPLHDDRKHYEFMVLDAFQAGLSWRTVLHKRENFRKAFANFDPRKVAKFGAADRRRLLADAGIVRNRAKVDASIRNAGAFLAVQREFGTFDRYIWGFSAGRTVRNRWTTLAQLPARTELSDRISADLKARGFGFCGSTIVYAYLQAAGIVNDHLAGCPRRSAGG